MSQILIIDDEKDMLTLLKRIISEDTAHEVLTSSDPLVALEMLKNQHVDLVFTDLKMPRLDGLSVMARIAEICPHTPVVLITAFATIENAVEAVRNGAFDFITKPFRRERILLTIEKALKWREVVSENLKLRRILAETESFSGLIGKTPIMHRIFERIRQAAPTLGTVLITGPSGTGKELVARALHQFSSRREHALITVNCAALPENVIESELFGHVKGAFTGAWQDKKGLVQEAHEGTLFLDEIGELSNYLQTKLLRLLQEGEYKPVGSSSTFTANLRFIAATNQNIQEAVHSGRFREDLFYRLNVVHIEMPPLRERRDDIPLLASHFLKKYAHINEKNVHYISSEVLQQLMHYDFAGNVRELENIIERGVIFCRGDTLLSRDISMVSPYETECPVIEADILAKPFKEAKEQVLLRFHSHYIKTLLRESGGNITRAAKSAGIQRQYLHRLIREGDIEDVRLEQ